MPTVAAATGSPAAAARPASLDTAPAHGFTPGAILGDRYRIVGLLGSGGMGEVYRADDLKLGQPVALKFLARALASDPVRRERLFAEVRVTRQLSHPNICRVYDIAEHEGMHFLSMEFIDGEDLASLIKRIGYLPHEKAVDIARQLASGLAAAHARGVLHRDLKPANIMIDGGGRVRITDFGLAVAAGDEARTADVSGTPAYMAPEQLAGEGSSVRSDIYSLGLVLYEMYCGRKAFSATSMAELRSQKETRPPTPPSEIRAGIDPIMERVIMRCLERDPALRPASAIQLTSALPGGDPLAAALAAGETPSPEMVAASGLKEGLRPAVAFVLLLAIALGTIAATFMNSRAVLLERVDAGRPPAFLIERAKEIVRDAGYTAPPETAPTAFTYYTDFFTYIEAADKSSRRWDRLNEFTPFVLWYRQSPRPLERTAFLIDRGGASFSDPAFQFSGDVRIRLDSQGRLRTFEAIPPEIAADSAATAPDWKKLFSLAGFDLSKWKAAAPERNPLFYADARAAWEGVLDGQKAVPVRIEASAYQGKPVSFEIIGPWTRATRTVPAPVRRGRRSPTPSPSFSSAFSSSEE